VLTICNIATASQCSLIAGKFKEPVFHPNVFPSGTVDLNFLSQPETHWKSSVTIMEVTTVYILLYVWVFSNLSWCCWYDMHTHTYTHTHTGLTALFRTTRVSRYQKGKTNQDFTEARESKWQWHQLDHMQVCTLLQTDIHASTPPLSFLQATCPSCHPTNSVKALKAHCSYDTAWQSVFKCAEKTGG